MAEDASVYNQREKPSAHCARSAEKNNFYLSVNLLKCHFISHFWYLVFVSIDRYWTLLTTTVGNLMNYFSQKQLNN